MTPERFVAIFIFFLFFLGKTEGQESQEDFSKHHIGLSIGFGNQTGIKVPYVYEVILIQPQYFYTLKKRNNWSTELSAHPQFNWTRFTESEANPTLVDGIELGINFGFLMRKHFNNNKMSWYGGVGVGPHFISKAPKRQAKGFIFSDNIYTGITFNIFKDFILDFRPGFRHISNANLVLPNGGVNTFLLNIGFMKKID